MSNIRAYFVKKTSLANGAARFTFEVEEGYAETADRLMGMPSQASPKLYDISLFVDAPSPFYTTEESIHREQDGTGE